MNDFVCKPFSAESLLQTIALWTTRGEPGRNQAAKASPAELASLPETLPGINVAEGLRYLDGHERPYRNLLLRFRLDHGRADQQIALLLADGKRVEAQREAHSIKGVAAQMGANDLSACAARLESALKNDDVDVTQKLAGVAEALAVVMNGLGSLNLEVSLTPDAASAATRDHGPLEKSHDQQA
jgi:HPt (histidine-containing phosphotransfer) domain-containing protein